MDWLAESYLIENLKRDGTWEVQFGAARADYRCLTCDGEIEVSIEVIASYTAGDFATLGQRYLAERRQFCAELVRQQAGRCLGTAPTRYRALKGFHSAQELAGRHVSEIVFFNHDREHGRELIRGRISMDAGTEPAGNLIEMFRYHMARLTLFY